LDLQGKEEQRKEKTRGRSFIGKENLKRRSLYYVPGSLS
jgi:hypothetical protein